MTNISDSATPPTQTYSPTLVKDLPEIAQRYFNHAIAPGTSLARVVTLEMEGQFRLGNKEKFQTYAMTARQILKAPSELVWFADMSSGPIKISGTDGLYQSHGWNRFWMFKAIPLVQADSSPDLDRAAAARPAVESIWAPATLLPQFGARWTQIEPDKARVTLGDIDIVLTLDKSGRVREILTQRWSDLAADASYELNPFGGTVDEEASFAGFTIPSNIDVGYYLGTDDFFPFFSAHITSANYH